MMDKLIEFKTPLLTHPYLPGMHHFIIPAEIVQAFGGKLPIRLWCRVNQKVEFQCGLIAMGEGTASISLNKQRRQVLGLSAGDTAELRLWPDASAYGMDMPEELREVLLQDSDAERRFKLLTPGRQRYIIQYVSSVKSSQLRIDRALLLLNKLKQLPEGKESFRAMLGK